MSLSATPATQSERRCQVLKRIGCVCVPARQSEDLCHQILCLPRKVKVQVAKYHACPTATPETQARHQSQPSAISATPATKSGDPCHQLPRLSRKVKKVHVAKCHACHAKRASMSSCVCVCVGKFCVWISCVCELVIFELRKPRIHVTMCHACRTKKGAAPTGTPKTQARKVKVHVTKLPRLPRKVKVDVTK